ncbi:MAG: VOC family protein, partial [Rubrobacteraceae bacterium]
VSLPPARRRTNRRLRRAGAHDPDGRMTKANFLGFNHVAVEVGDIEAALEFYGKLFEVKLRGRGSRMAFIDAGDQFLALSEGRTQAPDEHRHIGLVVDDHESLRQALEGTDVKVLRNTPGGGLDFLDPWGNYWQVVEYENVQFTKAPEVLEGMDPGNLRKSEKALEELRKKGMAPE